MLHPAVFAFSLSAFLLCAQYNQIRSHALRHDIQHSLWGVKLQPSDRAANYSAAFHSTAVNLTPRLFGCAALAPKRKSNLSWHNQKQSAAKLPSPSHSLRLHVVGCHLPYPLLQPASPTTCKEQLSVSPCSIHPKREQAQPNTPLVLCTLPPRHATRRRDPWSR